MYNFFIYNYEDDIAGVDLIVFEVLELSQALVVSRYIHALLLC